MTQRAEPGDVVQLDPEHCRFGPVFVIVKEVREWGVQGYFMAFDDQGRAQPAYIRINHDKYVWIGRAEWIIGSPPEEPAASDSSSS